MDSVTAERYKEQGGSGSAAALAQERQRGIEDEEMASRSAGTLLVTAPTRPEVETLARRIHQASSRAIAPFVQVRADALPIEPWMLRESCSALLDDATGGSILITDVEEMPAAVQAVFVQLLDVLQSARTPSAAIRLITGTTVSLLDRIVAGRFSDRLFYRLNVIHLVIRDALTAVPFGYGRSTSEEDLSTPPA